MNTTRFQLTGNQQKQGIILLPAEQNASADQDLINRLKAGDQAAYKQLIDKHWPILTSVAHRMLGSADDAADCVQNAMIQVIRKLDSFEGRSSLATWLRKIVVNEALMELRRRKRRAEQDITDLLDHFDDEGHRVDAKPNHEASLEHLAERDEIRQRVHETISQLPDIYRVTVVLRDIEGYSTQETAEMLNIEVNTVKTRLHRGRLALRNLLITMEPA